MTVLENCTSDTDNVVLNPLSLSLIPQGQPPRPNTAVQYPVFNPKLPRLQSSPSPLYAQGWSNLLRYYPGDLGSIVAGILTYGVQVGYRGNSLVTPPTITYMFLLPLYLGTVSSVTV